MTFVRTLLRWLLMASLAAACAAQPLALDACRAACDSARSAQVAAVPPCHHAAAGAQIGQPTRPCRQDHAVVPADAGVPAQPLTVESSWYGSAFAAVTPRTPADSPAHPSPFPIALDSHIPLRV